MDMDGIPVVGLEDLERHLDQLIESPETPLGAKLFDEIELQLTEHNIPPTIPRLLPKLTHILLSYQKDPAILVSLAIKLLKPIKFTQALTLASEESLIQAFQSTAPSANILALTVIEKAAASPSDAAILSIMQGVVASFVKTWLSSPTVEVGEKATRAIGDLLEVDCDRRPAGTLNAEINGASLALRAPPGQGLLWRRIFNDKEIYRTLFSLCDLATTGSGEGQLNERQKSLAQARLLRVLPRLAALDFKTLTRSNFPDVEAAHGVQGDKQGLLYYAAARMVDKEDVLMHITLIDFFAEFLNAVSMTDLSASKVEYLGELMREVTTGDEAMYKSLESLAMSENSSPELVELLVRLNEFR